MNRNCLFNKALALILCAVLLIGYLPSIAVFASAAENNDWESDLDVVETTTEEPVETEPPAGSEENPIFLGALENTIQNTGITYYQGRFNGMVMTATGGEFSIIYNGESFAAVDGVVSMAVASEHPMYPVVFAIEGDGEVQVNFAYPVGSMENPATAVLGDNNASVSAGSQGYFWTYIAEQDGTLVVGISAETGWSYVINNMTTYAYGDMQWSDSDPVVNPAEIEVSAGDQLEIVVNTYDPATPYAAPEGNITVNLAYKVEEPVLPEVGELVIKSAALTLQSSLTANIQVEGKYFASGAYTDPYVVCVMDGVETTITEYRINQSNGRYIFDFEGISSVRMLDIITIKLYATYNGHVFESGVREFSVKNYCKAVLDAYTAAAYKSTRRTVVDLLSYGSAAQVYNNFRTNDLPIDYLTEAQKADGTSAKPSLENILDTKYVELSGATTAWKGVSLILDNSVIMQLRFTPSSEDLKTLTVKIEAAGKVWNYNYESFSVAEGKDNQFTVAFDGLNADQMRVPVYCTIYQNGVAVSNTLRYSIESYAFTQQSVTARGLGNLVIAMIKYGDSADAM